MHADGEGSGTRGRAPCWRDVGAGLRDVEVRGPVPVVRGVKNGRPVCGVHVLAERPDDAKERALADGARADVVVALEADESRDGPVVLVAPRHAAGIVL